MAGTAVLPGSLDLSIYRGDTFEQGLSFTDGTNPIALPTTSWRAYIRRQPTDLATVEEFTVDATGAAGGLVILSLTEAETTLLPSGCVWDLELTAAGDVRTYLRGHLTVVQDVTR